MTLDEVTAAALALSPEERAELVGVVESSLPFPEIDPVVLVEARRRMDDIRSGRVKAIPADEVLDELDRMAL